MADVRRSLRTVVERFGPRVLDDADELRSLLDDMPEEDVSSTEINLLVDAVRFGAVARLQSLLEHGADPATAVASAGGFLAAQRGATNERSAVWACATLGYALDLVPEQLDLVPVQVEEHPADPVVPPPAPTQAWVDTAQVTWSVPDSDTVLAGTSASAEEPGRSRRRPAALVAVLTILIVIGAVVAVALLLEEEPVQQPVAAGATSTTASSPSSGPTESATTTQSTTPTTSTATTDETVVTTSVAAPTSPEEAETLTEEEAIAQLSRHAEEDGPGIRSLRGFWVPQVSSKCAGVPVDIEPDYVPDGVPDVQHVSAPQILALHLQLADRFDALTSLPTTAGIVSDRPLEGACQGELVWMSVVPQVYGTAAAANSWCDANVPPVDECLARFVSPPGGESVAVERS